MCCEYYLLSCLCKMRLLFIIVLVCAVIIIYCCYIIMWCDCYLVFCLEVFTIYCCVIMICDYYLLCCYVLWLLFIVVLLCNVITIYYRVIMWLLFIVMMLCDVITIYRRFNCSADCSCYSKRIQFHLGSYMLGPCICWCIPRLRCSCSWVLASARHWQHCSTQPNQRHLSIAHWHLQVSLKIQWLGERSCLELNELMNFYRSY